MADIRSFRGDDIAVLAAMLAKDQPFAGVTEQRFLKKVIFEENFDPAGLFVAEEDGVIRGFLNALYRRVPVWAGVPMELDQGWFQIFCVPGRADVPTIGAALLEAGERYLAEHGKTKISTGYFPTYFTQGVDEFHEAEQDLFRGRGYRASESISLELDLTSYAEPENMEQKRKALAEQGFYLGPMRMEHIPSILDAESPFGNASWAYEFRSRIVNGDLGALQVCAAGEKVIGVAACHDPDAPSGRFGPFGVDPAYRGHGIGAVLLADALGEMKRRGDKLTWMQWVSESGPAYHLYSRAGYRRRCRYETFSKG